MMLREAENYLLNKLTLKGLPQITKVSYSKEAAHCKLDVFDPVTGEYKKDPGNIVIETDGVALKEVLAKDHVDNVLTTSNDIIEILKTLGIEATRQSLIAELRFVLNSYGIYVNYRHLSTLCDIMTTRGILTPITRHGINRVDSGALRKCSFEETVEILLESSFHSEVDPLLGVTENIIMGQLAPYGTGAFDLMMDCSELTKLSKVHIPDDVSSSSSGGLSGGGTPIIDGNNTPIVVSPDGGNYDQVPDNYNPYQLDINPSPTNNPNIFGTNVYQPPTSPVRQSPNYSSSPIYMPGGQSTISHFQPGG